MEKITASETIDKGLISKNTQVAHATQYQKNNQPRQKVGKRPKQTTFPKKTYRQLTSTWKDAQHHLLLEKCKSKLQWDIILLQSECTSLKSLQTINAGEGVENKEPSCIVGGNRNWYTHYGRQYEDSLKTRNKTTIWPSNPTPRHIPWENQNWKRHMHPIVHCSTIYNS